MGSEPRGRKGRRWASSVVSKGAGGVTLVREGLQIWDVCPQASGCSCQGVIMFQLITLRVARCSSRPVVADDWGEVF